MGTRPPFRLVDEHGQIHLQEMTWIPNGVLFEESKLAYMVGNWIEKCSVEQSSISGDLGLGVKLPSSIKKRLVTKGCPMCPTELQPKSSASSSLSSSARAGASVPEAFVFLFAQVVITAQPQTKSPLRILPIQSPPAPKHSSGISKKLYNFAGIPGRSRLVPDADTLSTCPKAQLHPVTCPP